MNKAQLITDGIAQLKTKKQLIKESIILKHSQRFQNVKDDTGFFPEMEKFLGKSLRVASFNSVQSPFVINLNGFDGNTWSWPIECIAK